tara:strand:+ start:44 stop:319 length:276 start_codon:yes stop_codon:yes gene_type:complete
MKPFTSKHCAQYLTKESPLNQGLIRENDNRPREVINAEIKKAIETREESMSKPKPTVIDKLSKKKDTRPFKPSTELTAEEIEKMKSRKYNH